MKRTPTVLAAFFAVALASLVVLAEYPRFKRIEKRGPAPESVAGLDGFFTFAAVPYAD